MSKMRGVWNSGEEDSNYIKERAIIELGTRGMFPLSNDQCALMWRVFCD